MDAVEALGPDQAQAMLSRPEPLSAADVLVLLRFLKRSNDDLLGKLRQLKSEVSRNARK